MKRQSVIAAVSLAMVVALAAMLAKLGPRAVQLQVEPRSDGTVVLSLLNRTAKPVSVYNSLGHLREGEVPDLTMIRLRGPSGELYIPETAGADGYWSRNISLIRKVPVILDSLPANSSFRGTTRVSTLLAGYPDPGALSQATHAQIQCTVFLANGTAHGHSDWFPLRDSDKRP